MEAESPHDSPVVRGFWKLPSELRNAVYEQLLVTDCAFRLGYVVLFYLVTIPLLISLTGTTDRILTSLANKYIPPFFAHAQPFTTKP